MAKLRSSSFGKVSTELGVPEPREFGSAGGEPGAKRFEIGDGVLQRGRVARGPGEGLIEGVEFGAGMAFGLSGQVRDRLAHTPRPIGCESGQVFVSFPERFAEEGAFNGAAEQRDGHQRCNDFEGDVECVADLDGGRIRLAQFRRNASCALVSALTSALTRTRARGVYVTPYFRIVRLPTRSFCSSFIVGRQQLGRWSSGPRHSAWIRGHTSG
jgi:hypothetical protein